MSTQTQVCSHTRPAFFGRAGGAVGRLVGVIGLIGVVAGAFCSSQAFGQTFTPIWRFGTVELRVGFGPNGGGGGNNSSESTESYDDWHLQRAFTFTAANSPRPQCEDCYASGSVDTVRTPQSLTVALSGRSTRSGTRCGAANSTHTYDGWIFTVDQEVCFRLTFAVRMATDGPGGHSSFGLVPLNYNGSPAGTIRLTTGTLAGAEIAPVTYGDLDQTFVYEGKLLPGTYVLNCGQNLDSNAGSSRSFASTTTLQIGPPTVSADPVPGSVCEGSNASFSVRASGPGPFSYRWRKGGLPISDTANPSAARSTLTLSNVGPADVASYDCVVSNSCSSATSNAAALTLQTCAGCSLADVAGGGPNGQSFDGTVDGSDFVAFINSFAIGDVDTDAHADVAGGGASGLLPDGTIDGTDFVAFINAFALGC